MGAARLGAARLAGSPHQIRRQEPPDKDPLPPEGGYKVCPSLLIDQLFLSDSTNSRHQLQLSSIYINTVSHPATLPIEFPAPLTPTMPVAQETFAPSEPIDLKATKAAADAYHPCDPLTPDEIRSASAAFRTELLRKGVRSIKSCYVDLLERE